MSEHSAIDPKENAEFGSYEPLRAMTFSSTDRYIALFSLRFCLKSPLIIYIVGFLAFVLTQEHCTSHRNEA